MRSRSSESRSFTISGRPRDARIRRVGKRHFKPDLRHGLHGSSLLHLTFRCRQLVQLRGLRVGAHSMVREFCEGSEFVAMAIHIYVLNRKITSGYTGKKFPVRGGRFLTCRLMGGAYINPLFSNVFDKRAANVCEPRNAILRQKSSKTTPHYINNYNVYKL